MTESQIPGLTCLCGHGEANNGATLNDFAIDPALFRSDCVPSLSQTQDILGSIANGKAKLGAVETTIQRVLATLAALEVERENVKSYITCQESLLSPIRRVPPEILGQIFLTLRDMSEPVCFGDDALENVELWTLLRVCKFWRHVALSYSELWSRFEIVRQPFGRPRERDAEMMLRATMQLTKDCLLHSRSRPLHFVFHANEELLDVGRVLAKEAFRWASVAFNSFPVLKVLELEIQNQLPGLCSLDIDSQGLEWDSQTQPLQAFSKAPSLTCLSLNAFNRPQVHFILPWHQITHFKSSELREFLPILRLMPALVEFTSTEDICQPNEIHERTLLPNLERLRVTSNSPTTSQIFDALKVPKLSSLQLVSKRGFSRIYAEAVVQMVRWSDCSLKTLTITDYAVDSIFRIVSETRDLEELSVTNVMYPSELLGELATTLPKLKVLVLRKCGPDPKLASHLIEMVLARNKGLSADTGHEGQTLERVSVGLSSAPHSSFFESWPAGKRQLEEMGVAVDLEGSL